MERLPQRTLHLLWPSFGLPLPFLPSITMPGSKRRALKNLLSPHSASPVESTPAQSSLAPADELSLVTDIEARQRMISPNTQGGVADAPPASTSPPTSPIRKQLGGFAGLYGRRDKEVTADELAGDSNGGGKKKSSKQRFLEREVSLPIEVKRDSAHTARPRHGKRKHSSPPLRLWMKLQTQN